MRVSSGGALLCLQDSTAHVDGQRLSWASALPGDPRDRFWRWRSVNQRSLVTPSWRTRGLPHGIAFWLGGSPTRPKIRPALPTC